MGISDVFDPRAADLTPMSPDLGVYARDIQQSIGVNIRNNAKGGIGGADGGNEDQRQQSQQRDDLVRRVRGVHGVLPFFLAGGAISPRPHPPPHYPVYPGPGWQDFSQALRVESRSSSLGSLAFRKRRKLRNFRLVFWFRFVVQSRRVKLFHLLLTKRKLFAPPFVLFVRLIAA